jgi:hypothetical protein
MRASIARAATGAVGATALLGILLNVAPHHGRRLLAGWLVVLAFLTTRVLLGSLLDARAPGRSAFEAALRPRTRRLAQPAELDRLRRTLSLSSASAMHADLRLRPRLRAVAADRLAWSHGVNLDTRPDAARAALGEPAWSLVRPDAPAVDDRDARGPGLGALDQAVRALEEL